MRARGKHVGIGFAIVLGALLAELCAWGALAFLDRRASPTAQEAFNVRAFSERVDDERGVTLKPDVAVEVQEPPHPWTVLTGSARTRIPPQFSASSTDDPRPLFLFIGDSVPFGWGVAAEDSLPQHFAALRPDLQVVNGALPSYSLAQAVARYEHEFAGLPGQRFLYLQVYDPVSQYVMFGERWQEDDNWTNHPSRLARRQSLFWRTPWLARSHVLALVDRVYVRISGQNFHLRSPQSDTRFTTHVRRELEKLSSLATARGITVIVAPATISMQRRLNAPDPHAAVLDLYNVTLAREAARLGFVFLDTRPLLVAPDNSDFVDRCCHLSAQGADKVARQLASVIRPD